MTATLRLEGFRDLEQELARLGSHTTRRASARRASKKALQPMADLAQSLAPRGEEGILAPSISVGTRLSKRQAALHRRMFRGSRSAVEMFMGPGPDPRAWTQEFGTRFHPAQPYMRPAWDSDRNALLARIRDELRADIQRAVARAERRAARQSARG